MELSASHQVSPRPAGEPLARRVRIWHFVAFPALTMGAALLLSRLVESLLPDQIVATATYGAIRAVAISAVMASVIGWLAVGYRRQYEARLEARNKALEQTRDFLHSIIEGCGEAIVTLDAHERITSWNSAAERIFGWSADEVLGKGYERLLPDDPDVVEERRRVAESIRAGNTVRDHRTFRLHRDGTRVVVRITWSPLYDRIGRYTGATAIVLDITPEARMKQRLAEQQRLAAVGELAAQVAHEVRNPLAGIRGACEVILGGRDDDPQVKQEIGREVLRQIDRLNRTVNDLLQFSRPETIRPEPVDLHRLIDHVVGVFREDPLCRLVAVDRQYATDLPPLELDKNQFEQVFYNLLLNASQVMDHRGTITIVTKVDDAVVDVRVRDTGPGIPSGVAANIFKPFFSTRAQGTGLGLTIVRKIVQAHQGTIEAGTAPEGGAEFRIRLQPGGRTAGSEEPTTG